MATAVNLKERTAYSLEQLSDRVEQLKDNLLSRFYETDIERAQYYTEAYKETEGQPPCIRSAKALEKTLLNTTIFIRDNECIVGSKSSKDWGGPIYVEGHYENMYTKLATEFYKNGKKISDVYPNGVAGVSAQFLQKVPNITEKEYRTITEDIIPYWKGKTRYDIYTNMLKEKGRNPLDSFILAGGDGQGHVTIGIEKVLRIGFKGISYQAQEQLKKLDKNDIKYDQRRDFLEAAIVSAEAVCSYAERYADLAQKMAKSATGKRRKELLEISERCRQVPARAPRNFLEALQSVWLTQVVTLISYGDNAILAPGRVDQYVYPFYKKDMEAGLLTLEEAFDGVAEYCIQIATNIYFGPNNVTIGGVDKKGENAVNDVTILFLKAHKLMNGLRNGLAVRTSKKNPPEYILAACDVHRKTAGIAFYNDDIVIRDLVKDGYTLEDARNYSIVGCVEPTGSGNNNGYTAGNGIWMACVLEMALNEGRKSNVDWPTYRSQGIKRNLKKAVNEYAVYDVSEIMDDNAKDYWPQLGPKTKPASEFKTMEDVQEAFKEQLHYALSLAAENGYLKDKLIAEYYPLPLISSTIEGCIETGMDITRGGAKYCHSGLTAQGLATVSDSLTAIKWAVFDKKIVTMTELMRHLNNNFEDAEELRQQLLRAPKYGNDNEYADEMALWVANTYSQEVSRIPFWMGGAHRSCLISALTQSAEGAMCAATADGRLAGMPVSNGMSPTNTRDVSGLTATLRSAAYVSSPVMSDGTSVNITINPKTIMKDEGLNKFASTIEAYFDLGGRQVQCNPISKETLLNAQRNPEENMSLNVKVSGFSMRFVDLPKNVQDDIIARTEYETL